MGLLDILKPHLFFEDQMIHLEDVAKSIPSVQHPLRYRQPTRRLNPHLVSNAFGYRMRLSSQKYRGREQGGGKSLYISRDLPFARREIKAYPYIIMNRLSSPVGVRVVLCLGSMKMNKLFIVLFIGLMVALGAVTSYAIPNPAAAYAQALGYDYSNDDGGKTIIPGTDVEFNAWDFFRGKVGSEYGYGEQYGYDTVNRTVKVDGCVRSFAVCIPKDPQKMGTSAEISLEDLMRQNGEPLWAEALDLPPSDLEASLAAANETAALKTFPKQTNPSEFDWRDVSGSSYIGSVRNQGSCGSCYSFGAAAAAEGSMNYALGNTDGNCADLSEAYIAWCLGKYGAYSSHFSGCDGADYNYQELAALTNEGICAESQMPYNGGADPGSCTWGGTTTVFESWARVTSGDIDAIKTAIITYGVVDAAVYVDTAFENYSSGVHDDSNNSCTDGWYTTSNHAISLVGWDDNPSEGGGGVWILRNSWGTSWGESGYMRIRYDAAVVHCAVCYMVYDSSLETPPSFGANPGPLSVTTGVADAFTVSATGNPTPGLVLQSTTASSGYSFTAGTGELTYTAPLADVGSRTFTFHATNSAGTATQTVSVTVVEGAPSAPASIWASATNTTDFTAAWSSVSGATSYRLDVSTNATFSGGGGGGGTLIDEDFTDFSDWTDSGTAADTSHFGASSPCRALGTGDALISPAVDYPTQMTFYVDSSSGGNGTTTTNYYSLDGGSTWLPIGSFTVGTAGATETQILTSSPDLSGSTNVLFRFVSAFYTWYLDDVVVSGGGGTPDFVDGYSNRTVAGTSQSVTGLTAGATYYFRSRAVSGGGASANSSVANVTTLSTLSAPVFGANPGPASTTEGIETSFTVSASGVPSPTLALDSTTASSGYGFTAGTGELTYTPPIGDAGSKTFTFSATNSEGTASQIVTVSVTAATAPVFTGGAGPYSTTVGVAVAFTVTASGTPSATLALDSTTASSGYSFTPASGAFTYTPPVGDVGTPTFTFTASNAAGVATQVTSVTVAAIPATPPTVDPIGAQVATTTADFEYTVTATEADGDPFTFACTSAVDSGTWAFDTNSGDFLFAPTVTEVGARTFTFTASDKDGTSDPVVMNVTVSEGVPSAPTAIWASGTNDISFTAAWSASTGATGYRLDVGTNATFSSGSGAPANLMSNAGFETGDGTDWDKFESNYGVFVTDPYEGVYAAECAATATRDLMQAVAITGDGVTEYEISYWYRITAGDGSDLRIWSSWASGSQVSGDNLKPGTYNTVTTNWTKMTYHVVPASGANVLNFEVRTYSGATTHLDNFFVGESGGGSSTPDYVPGYSNRIVSATSQSVTGLSANATYYFRARAVSGAGASANSATATVTTTESGPADQTITFPAIADQIATNTVNLSATASSGLTVGFAVGSGPASIASGTTLTFTGAGSVSIVASQAGDASWNPAPNMTNTFIVTKAAATVTLSDLSQMYDGSAKSATVATTPGGLSVTTTYDGSGSAPSAVGDYEVISLVSEALYSGGVTDTFSIVSVTNVFEDWVTDEGEDPADPDYAPDADVDGDGADTWDEFLADTDPSLSNSCLILTGAYTIATGGGTGGIVLAFPASTGRYYQLEYCTGLTNHLVGTNNLGWGIPGMAVTNDSTGTWYGVIRALLQEP